MKNNKFAEILSLEETDLFDNDIIPNHRRSKSSSQFNSPNNETAGIKNKYYLIEKKNPLNKEINTNITDSSNNTSNLIDGGDSSFNISLSSKKRKEKDTFLTTDRSKSNFTKRIENNIRDRESHGTNLENYSTLKEKYGKMKEKYKHLKTSEKNWRNSYFTLIKDSLPFEETIKNLMEENRIHQEYIISLENKLNKLFATCNSITSNFHNNMYKNMVSSINSGNDMSFENINPNTLNNKYNDILNDYKKQLEILADEKESLSTNLSISRHQQLQCTIKLENLQTRVVNLEQARMEDLKVLEKFSN